MNPYHDQPVMYAEKDEKTVAEIRAAALKTRRRSIRRSGL